MNFHATLHIPLDDDVNWCEFYKDKHLDDDLAIKEEQQELLVELDDGGYAAIGAGIGGYLSPPTADTPKPMEGLHETCPPPFLDKTFEMVEDHELIRLFHGV
ncbi:hypothetical protein Nepgr_019923 [Nepenthes gracilis]|uniref:Uncharacterized protein n=1 Tax=Nepenthes gracilis TaxID=150966 RepID=A0AAD3SW54_NEPGR|nr:hypothetical protein Nepgr_019923 [Nepenthes gracilis]